MSPFKHLLFTVLTGVFLLGLNASPSAGQSAAQDFSAVDTYINEMMRLLPIPGLSLAIVRGDEIVYQKGYGIADRKSTAVTPQTPFPIASVTKTFTALAIQQLVESGQIDLDQPLQTVLSEFQLADAQTAETITIRHLLDHTSGISTLEGTQPYLHSPNTTFAEAMVNLSRYRLKYRPGEQREYSNWNYILLGEVVARVSGQPYPEYIQTRILDPLEMTHASLADHHTISGTAQGNAILFGLSVPHDEPYIPVSLSAGYMTATAEDLARFLIPYLNYGRYQNANILSPRGVGWYDVYWNWHPGRPADITCDHSGGHDSFNTDIQIFPLHKVGVVVLMNTRLDTLFPAPSSAQIAFNVGRIALNATHAAPSALGFYRSFIFIDSILLVLAAFVIWQIAGLKRFHHATHSRGKTSWAVVMLDLFLAAMICLFPTLLGSQWSVILAHRPDVAWTLLGLGFGLGALGLIKFVWTVQPRSVDQIFEVNP